MDDPAIYLDNFASTPIDPRVAEAFVRSATRSVGNPSSTHAFGARRSFDLETARVQVRKALGAVDGDVVFTSGATEANNLALQGVRDDPPAGKHAVIGAIEHASVLASAARLREAGWDVDFAKANVNGIVEAAEVGQLIREQTSLVSVMGVNNELGTIQPIEEIGELVRSTPAFFHCDLSQALGKVDVSVTDSRVDLATVSGHKIYGPQGIGALYLSTGAAGGVRPLAVGGGQELGLRSGTQNVAGAVAFGVAAELAVAERREDADRISGLRDRLAELLDAAEVGFVRHLLDSRQVAGLLHGHVAQVPADALLANVPKIAISQGSACHAGSSSPSEVLSAIGVSDEDSESSLRISLGRFTTLGDVDEAADEIISAIHSLRGVVGVAA